jgi:phage shock protein PspC (stress-responsive transcriptional regulator)
LTSTPRKSFSYREKAKKSKKNEIFHYFAIQNTKIVHIFASGKYLNTIKYSTMKETINVNIAGQAFTMDMDAYTALTAYLDDIARRLPQSDTETMADIEGRIAELFREKVPSPMMVITYGVLRNTMNQIGRPEDFGAANRPLNSSTTQKSGERRLYRSRTDRSIAGVCSGVAKYFGLETSLVRIAAILCIFAAGATLWIYLILWLVLPYEPEA